MKPMALNECGNFQLFYSLAFCCILRSVMYTQCLKTSSDQENDDTVCSHQPSLHKAISKEHFLAATRTNLVYENSSSACVVDPAITECTNLGFAAFLLLTLEHASLCHSLGSPTITIIWKACNSGCSKNSSFNSWEWYFESVNPGIEEKSRKVICIGFAFIEALVEQKNFLHGNSLKPILNSSFRNRSSVPGFEKGHFINSQERSRVNNLIKLYHVKPNAKIRKIVNDFYQRSMAGYRVLGVHVRGTDIWHETVKQRLPLIMRWISHAMIIYNSMPDPKKIFLASDNHQSVDTFVRYFGRDNVTFIDAFRADLYDGALPAHDLAKAQRVDQRELGTQVLMDILLLAKCDHFLHSESSVTAVAAYFNPHMTSHFLEEEHGTENEENDEEEEEATRDEEFSSFAKCFERNSPSNACPNTAKGQFVNLAQALTFLRS